MTSVVEADIKPDPLIPCGAKINQLLQDSPGAYSFPKGVYQIEETLRIPSHTHLLLEDGAVFRLADGAAITEADYLLTNADPFRGNEDIILEGGTFHGNQKNNPRPNGLFAEGYTGAMVHFQNVKNLTLRNIIFTNAEAYYSRFTEVHEFHIENITFDSQWVRHNNDGIHLGGNCSHGVIKGLRAMTPGVTGDDLVALNADDALSRNEVRGMTNGPIHDILIEDLKAHSCHTFVRLLSTISPIRNITIRNLKGGCRHSAINADGARRCRIPVFDESNPPTPDGIGILENIQVSGLHVHKTSEDDPMALIELQERMVNFSVSDFHRELFEDANPDAPSVRLQYVDIQEGHLDIDVLDNTSLLGDGDIVEKDVFSFHTLEVNTSCLESTPAANF